MLKSDEIIIARWMLEEDQTQSWRLASWAEWDRPHIWDHIPVK